MTKALDYLIIVVVALFIIILLVIGFRSCGNLFSKEEDGSKLKNEVNMGEEESTNIPEDTLTFDSEGIDPALVDSLGNAVETELAASNDVDEDPIVYGSDPSDNNDYKSTTEPEAEESSTRTNTSPAASSSSSGPTFFVISGSYLMEENAKSEVSRLKSMGYPAEVLEFAKSEYFTVCVKRFDGRSAAESFKNEILSDKGIKSYVLKQRFK